MIVLFYESSMASLLAAVFTMLAKECLTGQLHPVISDSSDRRRRVHALNGWGFSALVKTSRILLLAAFCFLLAGIGQRFFSSHPHLIYPLALLAAPGLVGYLAVVFCT